MKQLFKQAMATLALLSLMIVMVFTLVAGISGDNGTLSRLIMATELRMKSASRITMYGTSYLRAFGQSYIQTGDSTLFKTGKTIARLDSFTTTAATDTVLWLGARRGDVVMITRVEPSYSSTPDTGSSPYAARTFTTGQDTIVVSRTKIGAANTLKSAAIYGITVFSKQ